MSNEKKPALNAPHSDASQADGLKFSFIKLESLKTLLYICLMCVWVRDYWLGSWQLVPWTPMVLLLCVCAMRRLEWLTWHPFWSSHERKHYLYLLTQLHRCHLRSEYFIDPPGWSTTQLVNNCCCLNWIAERVDCIFAALTQREESICAELALFVSLRARARVKVIV